MYVVESLTFVENKQFSRIFLAEQALQKIRFIFFFRIFKKTTPRGGQLLRNKQT